MSMDRRLRLIPKELEGFTPGAFTVTLELEFILGIPEGFDGYDDADKGYDVD